MAIAAVSITPVGIDSVGGRLQYSDATGNVFTDVPLVTKIVPPQVQVKTLKATAINQVLADGSFDRTERYVDGMIEPGELQFSCVYQNAVYQSLVAIGGATLTWRLILPDTTYVQFPGILDKLHIGQLSTSENEAVTIEANVKVAAASQYFEVV